MQNSFLLLLMTVLVVVVDGLYVEVVLINAGGCYNFSMVTPNVVIVPMLAFFNKSVHPTVTNESWCFMNLQFQMTSYMYVCLRMVAVRKYEIVQHLFCCY